MVDQLAPPLNNGRDGERKSSRRNSAATDRARDDDARQPAATDTAVSPVEPPQSPVETPDPFDPARLRLAQNFADTTGVKKLHTVIPVARPNREVFFQVHPGAEYAITVAILELKTDRAVYLVTPILMEALAGETTISSRNLVTCITRQGSLFLWPLRLPGADGRFDDWGRSALEAAVTAKSRWVRLTSNMDAGMYDVYPAAETLPGPDWPQMTFRELLRIAFKDKVIEGLDHPVLRRLRGEG